MENTSRRNFLSSSALASMGTLAALGNTPLLRANESTLAGRFYKTLKIGMAKEGETLVQKFKAVKEAGFVGFFHSPPQY